MKEKFAKCVSFDENIRGRIGGNPPITIEGVIPDEYLFYATLVNPYKEDRMISVLIHSDFDTLIDNNIYPKVEVKIIEHPYSPEGTIKEKSNINIGVKSISEYKDEIHKNEFFLVKVGGNPRLIQPKNYYFDELHNDGYSFLMQIDEEGYCDDLLKDDYPFSYGALYLYSKWNDNQLVEIIAGFWQYS